MRTILIISMLFFLSCMRETNKIEYQVYSECRKSKIEYSNYSKSINQPDSLFYCQNKNTCHTIGKPIPIIIFSYNENYQKESLKFIKVQNLDTVKRYCRITANVNGVASVSSDTILPFQFIQLK